MRNEARIDTRPTRAFLARAAVITALTMTATFGFAGCSGAPAAEEKPPTSTSQAPADENDDADADADADANANADADADTDADTGASGDQSTADACALVQTTLAEVAEPFQNPPSDPAAMVPLMQAAGEKISGLAPQIKNAEVGEALVPLQDLYAGLAEAMQAVVDGDTEKALEVVDLMAEAEAAVNGVRDVCGFS